MTQPSHDQADRGTVLTGIGSGPFWVGAAGLILLLWLLGPLLVPLAIAALLAILLWPVRERLEALGVTRFLASVGLAVFVAIIAIFLLGSMVPLLADQVAGIWERLRDVEPAEIERLLNGWLNTSIDLQSLKPDGSDLGNAFQTVMGWGSAALNSLFLTVLLPVFLFFLLVDGDRWQNRLIDMAPEPRKQLLARWLHDLSSGLRGYMTGQAMVCLSQGLWHATLLYIVGVDFAIVLGLLTGLSALIPFVGNFVMLLVTLSIAAAQFDSWLWIATVPLIFGSAQIMETLVLAPWLIGKETKLHPLAVILAVIAGGRVAGFAGALLALPALTAASVTLTVLLLQHRQSQEDAADDRQENEAKVPAPAE